MKNTKHSRHTTSLEDPTPGLNRVRVHHQVVFQSRRTPPQTEVLAHEILVARGCRSEEDVLPPFDIDEGLMPPCRANLICDHLERPNLLLAAVDSVFELVDDGFLIEDPLSGLRILKLPDRRADSLVGTSDPTQLGSVSKTPSFGKGSGLGPPGIAGRPMPIIALPALPTPAFSFQGLSALRYSTPLIILSTKRSA